jgi:hypothetical protein
MPSELDQLQQQQPPAFAPGACFAFIGLPQQVMLHSLQVQAFVTVTSAPQLSHWNTSPTEFAMSLRLAFAAGGLRSLRESHPDVETAVDIGHGPTLGHER